MDSMPVKHCNRCDTTLPFSEFHIRKSGVRKGKLYSDCKKCHNEVSRAARLKNPRYQPNWELQKKYGITLEQKEAMAVAQEFKCKICGTHQDDVWGSLHVDHCHITGKVRGLLCVNCNQGVGKFKDDQELLKKAIDYLKEYE
ncbi:MAG: endonuclease VII domain-containing protein [Betaproteobacteria bacterium]